MGRTVFRVRKYCEELLPTARLLNNFKKTKRDWLLEIKFVAFSTITNLAKFLSFATICVQSSALSTLVQPYGQDWFVAPLGGSDMALPVPSKDKFDLRGEKMRGRFWVPFS